MSIHICFFVIILSLSWLKISSSYLTSFKGKSDSGLQLKFILTNPIRYLLIIFHTIEMFFFSYLEEMVGISLGTLNVRNSSIFVFFLLIVLGIFLFKPQNGKKKVLNIKESIFTFCMIIGTIFLTFTSLYMQWTTPYKEYVDGIQGRYFLPLLLPLGLLFMVKDKKINKKISYLCTMANIISLIAIVTTFI